MEARGDSFEFDHTISHGDVDFVGELKVAALLGLLEQAAIEASAQLGFDTDWYGEQGGYWIVRRTRLVRHVALGGHDRVRVRTWVDDFRRARSLRRYEIGIVGQTEPAITASTDWVFCDAASGRPRRVPKEMETAFAGAAGSLPALPRAAPLPLSNAAAMKTMTRRVCASHLDHVAHVNNGVWASFLEDGAEALLAGHGWSVPEMLAHGGAFRLQGLDLEYLAQGLPGDTLAVHSAFADAPPPRAGNGAERTSFDLHQSVEKPDATTAMRATSHWQWLQRADVLGRPPTRPKRRSSARAT
ncbi:MAG: acyl-ACP thioesterase domain-containing protein [Deltaproteobacteria bacterium]